MIDSILEFIKLAQQVEKQQPSNLELSQISGINLSLFKSNQWQYIKSILNIFDKIIWVRSGHLLYLTDFWQRPIMPDASWKMAGIATKEIVKNLVKPGPAYSNKEQETIFNQWLAAITAIQSNYLSDQELMQLVGGPPKDKLLNLINQLKSTL